MTRSIRWRTESESINSELGLQELTNALQTIVTEERLAGAKARIALNGQLCVTRVVTGTADHVRRELQGHEERSQLYLSLGPGPKARASSIQHLDARHQHALLTVASQRTLDIIVGAAEQLGVHIEAIEPSLVAITNLLTRLPNGGEETSLVIQVDERGAEIGICDQGKLLLDYRPAGYIAAENVAAIVEEHHARLERYVNRVHGYESASIRRVYLTGESGPVDLARRKFSTASKFSVHVIDPSEVDADWEVKGEPPGTDQSAVLGAALAFCEKAGEHRGPNLMEHVLAEARPPMKPVLLRSAVPLAAILLVAMAQFGWNTKQSFLIRSIQAQIDELTPLRVRAKELELASASVRAKAKQLRDLQRQLDNCNWEEIIAHIGQSMPDDVWLDHVSFADGASGSIAGASYAESGIYDFTANLEQVPQLEQVALAGTGPGSSAAGPTTEFDLEFLLTGNAGASGGDEQHD